MSEQLGKILQNSDHWGKLCASATATSNSLQEDERVVMNVTVSARWASSAALKGVSDA